MWVFRDNLYSFLSVTCYLCYRFFIKLQPAMPYIKTSQKSQPLSTLLEIKSQKCGLRRTVFSVNGNEYTGEWQDNKKHGEMLFSVSLIVETHQHVCEYKFLLFMCTERGLLRENHAASWAFAESLSHRNVQFPIFFFYNEWQTRYMSHVGSFNFT